MKKLLWIFFILSIFGFLKCIQVEEKPYLSDAAINRIIEKLKKYEVKEKYYPYSSLNKETMFSQEFIIFNYIPEFISIDDIKKNIIDNVLYVEIKKDNYEFEMVVTENEFIIKNILILKEDKNKEKYKKDNTQKRSFEKKIDLDKIIISIDEAITEDDYFIGKTLVIKMPFQKNTFIKYFEKAYNYFFKKDLSIKLDPF